MTTKAELEAELLSLEKQLVTFTKQRGQIEDMIKRTEGAMEMTAVFIRRLDIAAAEDAAKAAAKKPEPKGKAKKAA